MIQQIDRFILNVNRRGPNECWPWKGSIDGKGYGVFNRQRAHRVAYWLAHKDFDKSKLVCHSCDNPICCNPAHLWLGSHSDNMQDMVNKGRNHPSNSGKIKCKHGHFFSEENTYYYEGRRQCKLCKKLRKNGALVEIIEAASFKI